MATPDIRDVPPIDDYNRLLNGKIAAITGAGTGIGAAIAQLFARHGAHVELAEIDPDLAASSAAAITDAGGSVRAHVLDVRDEAQVATWRDDVLATHGRVDVLVNNVGDFRPLVRFAASGAESWQAMYEINLLHFFIVTHAFLGDMVAKRSGNIINVHSVEGMRGYPSEPVYGAMKAAVAHFTTCLAGNHGRDGIRVNGIGPDLTQTPQVDYITGWEEHTDMWESWAPVGRLGWPEEQARVALFLASDLSSYVTGHNIPVDGGSLAQSGWMWSPTERRFTNRPRSL